MWRFDNEMKQWQWSDSIARNRRAFFEIRNIQTGGGGVGGLGWRDTIYNQVELSFKKIENREVMEIRGIIAGELFVRVWSTLN